MVLRLLVMVRKVRWLMLRWELNIGIRKRLGFSGRAFWHRTEQACETRRLSGLSREGERILSRNGIGRIGCGNLWHLGLGLRITQ
jgi:hypothetical protein